MTEDDKVDGLVERVRDHLAELNNAARIDFISVCMDGYCRECGSSWLPCYCLNDE